MTRVAIYARYSTDLQREASVEDQIRICKERAEREGWTVDKIYKDQGISGTTLLRPGIQRLMRAGGLQEFDVVLAESIDRLSRDQEDIAGLYKRLSFAGIRIITLSEGEISELHIGLKGTMGALFIKDLADKTRRGLRGRVENGKSGGGKCYGYDVVKALDAGGEAIRGEREINKTQANIVRRIFKEYGEGKSPKAIAIQLNKEGISAPSGKGWGPSTIYGNRERGTGIINNELYIGRLVWNRLRYIKDPETGKRVSRLNPETDWIVKNVPELRIIDDALWQSAKARQKSLTEKKKVAGNSAVTRRPKYLFSGLMKCSECGGGYTMISKTHVGCSTARNKGTCDNRRAMKMETLEEAVLDGLRHRLMDKKLCDEFCREYTRHMNELRKRHNAHIIEARAEFEAADRELESLVDAICAGVPATKVKDRMWELENRKNELSELMDRAEEMPIIMHPNMAEVYKQKVDNLRVSLNKPQFRQQAADILRTLIDRIVLTPDPERDKGLLIDIEGTLAGMLALAWQANQSKPYSEPVLEDNKESQLAMVAGGRYARYLQRPFSDKDLWQVTVVAGVGFEPTTFRL